MNKKVMLLFLLFFGSSISCHWANDEVVPYVADQQQFVIPVDYFMLGTPVWLEEVRESDASLNDLYIGSVLAEYQEAAWQGYKDGLDEYFTALTQDLETVTQFFAFAHQLNQQNKQEMAERLLNVVHEHHSFLYDTPHVHNLINVLGYSLQFIQSLRMHTEDLQERLFVILPHDADNAVEFEENEGGYDE